MNDLATLILYHFEIPFPSRQLLELKYRCIWNFLFTNMQIFALGQLVEPVSLQSSSNVFVFRLD